MGLRSTPATRPSGKTGVKLPLTNAKPLLCCRRVMGAAGAGGAAVDLPLLLHAMPDHPAATMRALRGKGLNGALKAVKNVGFPLDGDFQRFVVFVAADFTLHHARNIVSATPAGPAGMAFPMPATRWGNARALR